MLNFIENLLHEKTKNSQSQILYAQWNYDKKVIPDVLRSISNLFPHYSLHDESHSITIINNIVRILGKENLEKLSAIDLWLILEASYSHDIGMAVSANEIKNTLDSEDFIVFFRHILRDKKNSLYEFASQFKIVEDKIEYKSKHLNLELHDGIKFILAEYYRSSHSNRSKDIISGENQEFKLSHFGAIIPKRIFKILGSICDSHTQNFEEVMKLSFSEVGIDTEDAHPRFIACMLRIGDLLDLDNHRFSDVMLRTLHKIPLETLNHKDKHLSIESFRVDRKIIEITARCKNYEVANITQHWFNYLHSEITNQMIKWNKIVPSKEFGYLPTIGNLRVELKKYDFIDGKEKPQFKVDTEKALTLLQGAGIYEDAYQSIREILQNAVDATLIRIWLEHGKDKDFKTPTSKDFLDLLPNYPITINIKEKKTKKKKKIWKIEIEDCGIGISKDDLKFLMNTGSSSKNRKKRDIIDSMPLWMKPSGTFGIGFQSIFMLTEKVKIKSKSFFDEKFQVITLNSPSAKKNGTVLLKRKKSNHNKKVGSKIIFEYATDKIPKSFFNPDDNFLVNHTIYNYDPIINDSFDIEISHIIGKTMLFFIYIPIHAYLKLDNDEGDLNKNYHHNKFSYFDSNTSLEIGINNINMNDFSVKFFYKGQRVDKNNWRKEYLFLDININIHTDDASKVLTLNREHIQDKYKNKLYKYLRKALFNFITKKYNEIFKTDDEKIIASMFLHYYMSDKIIKPYREWEDYLFTQIEDIKLIKLKELLNKIDTIKIIKVISKDLVNDRREKYSLKNNELTIEIIVNASSLLNITYFILHIVQQEGFKYIEILDNLNIEKIRKSKPKDIIDKSSLKLLLSCDSKSRNYIPCSKKYWNLRLTDNTHKSWIKSIYYPYFNGAIPLMVSPYFGLKEKKDNRTESITIKYDKDNENKLIDWVYENRYDKSTTKEEIKATYEQFREDINIDEINNEPNN